MWPQNPMDHAQKSITHYSLLFSKTTMFNLVHSGDGGCDVVWWGVVIKEMINNGSCEFYNTAMVIIIINLLETELTAPRWNNITISLLLYNNHSVLCWRPVSHAKSQKGWLAACKGWKGRNEREISLGNSMIDWKVYGPLNPPHAPAILKLYSFGHQSSLNVGGVNSKQKPKINYRNWVAIKMIYRQSLQPFADTFMNSLLIFLNPNNKSFFHTPNKLRLPYCTTTTV